MEEKEVARGVQAFLASQWQQMENMYPCTFACLQEVGPGEVLAWTVLQSASLQPYCLKRYEPDGGVELDCRL